MKSTYGFPGASPGCIVLQPCVSDEVEEALISRTLRGRSDAFADLVQPHITFLSHFARKRLQSESEAEDVVQQSILLALKHLGQFRREASFKTWLRAIGINETFRMLQRRTVPHVPLRDSLAGDLADPASSPDIQCEQQERAERLYEALARLPEKYRLMIQLRDLRELSIAETARSLSLTSSAVRTRHHRARKLLVRSLASVRRKGLREPVTARLRTASKCLRPV